MLSEHAARRQAEVEKEEEIEFLFARTDTVSHCHLTYHCSPLLLKELDHCTTADTLSIEPPDIDSIASSARRGRESLTDSFVCVTLLKGRPRDYSGAGIGSRTAFWCRNAFFLDDLSLTTLQRFCIALGLRDYAVCHCDLLGVQKEVHMWKLNGKSRCRICASHRLRSPPDILEISYKVRVVAYHYQVIKVRAGLSCNQGRYTSLAKYNLYSTCRPATTHATLAMLSEKQTFDSCTI